MSIAEHRLFDREKVGDVLVLTITIPKIFDEKIQEVGQALYSVVDDDRECNIIVDFRNVNYFSAAAFGKFITLNKKAETAGGKLVLCNIDPQNYEMFEITKLNKLICIQHDRTSALEAFTKKDS